MSEHSPVIDLMERVDRRIRERITISPSALPVAIAFIRQEKETAIIADEWEVAARWRDDEKQMIAALAGMGLDRYIKNNRRVKWLTTKGI